MSKYSEIAFKIISDLINLHKNDIVSIFGEIYNSDSIDQPLADIEFIEELAVAIRKREAFPVLEISTTNLKKRFFSEMPESVFAAPPNYYKHWIDEIDFFLDVGWKSYAGDQLSLSSKQSHQIEDSTKVVLNYLLKQKKKIIFLNFPSLVLAQKTGLEFEELFQIYFLAVTCNYRYLKEIGSELQTEFSSYANYLLKNDDLELDFKITRTDIRLFSGDIKKQLITALPAGFIELPIQRESLNGIYFAERIYYLDKIYENVKLKFENGIIRYIVFPEETNGNFTLQSELLSSLDGCFLTIGFNEQMKQFTNHIFYDRCKKDCISFVFKDRNANPIYLFNQNSEINKKI